MRTNFRLLNCACAVAMAAAFLLCGCSGSSGVQNLEYDLGKPTPQEAAHARAQDLEPMLTAAGFVMLPANTPARRARLESLPPLKLSYYVGRTGKLHYWMADPEFCNCMYVGSEMAYQRYDQMRLNEKWQQREARISENQMEAAQEEQMDMTEEMVNPYGVAFPGPGFYVW
jgi:hypothetical protein